MVKILLSLLIVVGVIGAVIWQTIPQREASIVTPVVIDEPTRLVPSVVQQEQNENISGVIDAVEEVPDRPVVDHYVPEIVHNPIIPVETVYVPLTEEEKLLYTKKREQAAEGIQQAMVEYGKYLDDPVKRAEIQESIQANREEYKKAMIKLGKEVLKEQSSQ